MQPTADDVLAVVTGAPQSVGQVGVAVAAARGADEGPEQGRPVGQWLAASGISLSGLQAVLDGLVRDGAVVEVRGRDLWDQGLPTAGTKAQGRYYLTPAELP